jgi:hypothetical protein
LHGEQTDLRKPAAGPTKLAVVPSGQRENLLGAGVGCVALASAGSAVLLIMGTERCSTDPGSLGNAWATAISDYCMSSGLVSGAGGGLSLWLIAAATLMPPMVALVGTIAAVRVKSPRVLKVAAALSLLSWIASLIFLLNAANVTFEGGAGG